MTNGKSYVTLILAIKPLSIYWKLDCGRDDDDDDDDDDSPVFSFQLPLLPSPYCISLFPTACTIFPGIYHPPFLNRDIV